MSVTPWLLSLKTRFLPAAAQRHPRTKRSKPARPISLLLEPLEDRWLPSTFTVMDNSDSSSDSVSLRYLVANAPAGSTIDFAPSVRSITLTSNTTLTIGTNLNIVNDQGVGSVTISGNDSTTVFTVNGSTTVTMSGLTIVNGNAGDFNGGGIDNAGTLTLSNSILTNNSTQFGDGGGIYTSGTLTVSNSTVSDNSTTDESGGGIYNDSATVMVMNSSTISGNSASDFGGGIDNNGGTLTVNDSTLSSDTASTGGSIENQHAGTVTVSNSTFADNVATDGTGIDNEDGSLTAVSSSTFSANSGDAIEGVEGTLTVNSSTFLGNSGSGINNVSGTLTVSTSTFVDNSGDGIENSGPGAATVTVSNSTFTGNDGGIYNQGAATVTVTSCNFSDNSGVGIENVGTLTVGNCTFFGNFGSGIDNDGTLTVNNCTFTGNSASSEGGGINNEGTLTVNGSSFMGNSAEYGGGIDNGGSATVSGSTLSDNSVTYEGGGLSNLYDGTLVINNSTVSNDSVGGGGAGGGIYNYEATLTANTITLSDNSASGNVANTNGGGLCNVSGTVTLNSSTISGNIGGSVESAGGGLFNSLSTLTVNNSLIADNSCTGDDGGGVYDQYGAVALGSCTLSGNTSGYGGAIGLLQTQQLTVTDCVLSGNSASDEGGGLYNDEGMAAVSGSTFSSDSAASGGGGIYNDTGGTVAVSGSTFLSDSATTDGGGIYNDATLTATNSTLSGNSADSDGGGIYNSGTLTVTNSTLSDNSASFQGGGIYDEGETEIGGPAAPATLNNTIVANSSSGGDLYLNPVGGGSYSGSYDLISDGSDSSSFTHVLQGNPLLATLGNYGGPTQTMALLPGSPAIDAGSNALAVDANGNALTTDQRGEPRIVNGIVDLGAFESQGFTLTATSGSNQSTDVNTAFPQPLTVTVTANDSAEPVNGGFVIFTAPSSGASATLSASTVTLNGGSASVTATANGTVGSYTVTAAVPSNNPPADFALTNTSSSTSPPPPVSPPPPPPPVSPPPPPGTGTISGTVFVDDNDNGMLDSGEPGVSGVTVQLTEGVAGQVNILTETTTTDANGNYTFTDLLAGTYVVSEDAPDTDAPEAAAGAGYNAQTVTLTVGGSQTVNLGLIPINPALPVAAPFVIYAPSTSSSDTNANLEAYIRGLYNSILDRAPEAGPTSLPFWENIFNDVQSGSQPNPLHLNIPDINNPYVYVAESIWQSAEHRADEVNNYYQEFLGRTETAAEQQYWVNQFLAGATEEDVVRGFLTSAEFLYDHRSDASLADTLNTYLLAGTATTTDLQTWNSDLSALDAQRASIQNQTFATPEDYQAQLAPYLNALDDETAKTGVLFDMETSSEYQLRALDSFYIAFIHRAGMSAEEQALLSLKDASGNPLDLGTIAGLMLSSPQYQANAVSSEV